jgi:hypothetical protein
MKAYSGQKPTEEMTQILALIRNWPALMSQSSDSSLEIGRNVPSFSSLVFHPISSLIHPIFSFYLCSHGILAVGNRASKELLQRESMIYWTMSPKADLQHLCLEVL